MKLEKFMKNEKQKKMVVGIIIGLILFVGGITLYRTFALYEEKKEFNVLCGRVPTFSKGNGDVELAVLIDGEASTEFPDKNSDAIVESITCDNGATGTWDYNAWGVLVSNLKKSKTTCTLSFRLDMIKKLKSLIGSESEIQTVDEFLLNEEDVDKLIVSTDGMNYIVENTILKDLIKNSTNYTTAIAKKLLSSEAISERAKYDAGFPCYLIRNNQNIFGDFISKPYYETNGGGTSNSSVTFLNNSVYYSIQHTGSYLTGVSNNKINTNGYHYLEMFSTHSTSFTAYTGEDVKGSNTLGFGTDQGRDSFDIMKSETYARAEASTTLTLDISNYQKEAYLKMKVRHEGPFVNNQVYTTIKTIALY